MAKGIFAGMTDYSHQSLNDIVEDLDREFRNVSAFIEVIEKNIQILEENGYWSSVLFEFKSIVLYSLKHYHTAKEELESIKNDVHKEVQEHHCKRLSRIASVSHELNIDIGKIWHQDYQMKNYEQKAFMVLENIYADTRDTAVNLLDLSNLADRLKDFVGKKDHGKVESQSTLLKILFLSSSPKDEERIRVDIELRRLEEELEAAKFRDNIVLSKKVAVKPETISKAMLDFTPNIVHFSGHGSVDGIAIEDEGGKSILFPSEGLQRLFSLFRDSLNCVVLNACYSENQAITISKEGIYVIGMKNAISDKGAIKFSVGFYQAIGYQKGIEFAFDMGMVLISQFVDDANIPTLWKDGKRIK